METIFYLSNSISSTIFAETLECCTEKSQKVIHSHSLFTAITELKYHHSEENKVVIADDLFNDTTSKSVKSLEEFVSIYKRLNSISKENQLNVKWCFFIDFNYYTGNAEKFNKYCKENGITLIYSGMYDVEQFAKFINF